MVTSKSSASLKAGLRLEICKPDVFPVKKLSGGETGKCLEILNEMSLIKVSAVMSQLDHGPVAVIP